MKLHNPPPADWPRVQHDWFEAAASRDRQGWRDCLTEDARSIGVDGAVLEGADAVVESLVAYYSFLDPEERIDRWIASTTPGVFVWHGTVAPDTEFETGFCTICTHRDGRIAELRFYGDMAALNRLARSRRRD